MLGWLALGQAVDQIVVDCPELTPEDIRACLADAVLAAADRLYLALGAPNTGVVVVD